MIASPCYNLNFVVLSVRDFVLCYWDRANERVCKQENRKVLSNLGMFSFDRAAGENHSQTLDLSWNPVMEETIGTLQFVERCDGDPCH